MARLFAFFLIALSLSAAAQNHPYTVIDKSCDCPEMEWKGEYVMKDIHQSANDIEIRFYPYQYSYSIIKVLTKKDGVYKAFLYHKYKDNGQHYNDSLKKYGIWEKYPYKKFAIAGKNLDSLMNNLFSYNIQGLPDQDEITEGPPVYKPYYLECKIGNTFKTYQFGFMDKLVRAHPEIKAFKDYLAIIDLFDELTADYDARVIRLSEAEQSKYNKQGR